ncbi:dihydrodipicolinate synthase family protein [Spirosoma validum]|uniref:Dihydrodipicolinate synthase family protein n=1 Tax=Spirosoma validum TaxID=2771355 RepID=A0A927B4I0_9BACT|nr:dihydrodipicolinate synthase family protein [Spirosoma validum]MBD2755052.1 dihydrodipicolinate synthase family protein [Spirosoma validum]
MNSTQSSLPHGFIPVMLTPFLDSGEVDYTGLSRLTDFYLEAGAAGLFANCLSSEMYELTESERLDVTKHVVKQVAGRVPVVATGSFGGTMLHQADFVKRIYDTGIQAVILTTCQLAFPEDSDAVFLDNLHQLMNQTVAIPLGLYECPVPYKRLISSQLLANILPTGRIIYHKDTSLDADEVARRLAVAESYKFGLYDAYMVNAVSSLKAGAAGLSCIQGNYVPELIVWLCENYDNEERETDVQRVQQWLVDSMDLLHTAYPTAAKYALQKRGLPISLYTRRVVDPLTPAVQEQLDTLLRTAGQLQEDLGIGQVA